MVIIGRYAIKTAALMQGNKVMDNKAQINVIKANQT